MSECCLEGRKKKGRDSRSVWRPRDSQEDKARRQAQKERKAGDGGRRGENVRKGGIDAAQEFDKDVQQRAERSKLEQFFIDKPYEFCRKLCSGEALEDVEVKPTFNMQLLAAEAQRIFQYAGVRGKDARGDAYRTASSEDERAKLAREDDEEARAAAKGIARRSGLANVRIHVPWQSGQYSEAEVQDSWRRRKQKAAPGWDGIKTGWWGLPATVKACTAGVNATDRLRRPLSGTMKVQGKFIKKPNKPLKDDETKVKAWRLIGKPLTFTKVQHGARMERRRVFFEKNGIWKPGDAQKGVQKSTASCVVHCRSF